VGYSELGGTVTSIAETFALPPKTVRHSDLERHGDSAYRSVAPCCGGMLAVRRNQASLKLLREDVCLRCGQRYWYVDTEINGESFDGEEFG